ncbi:MAG: CHAD domain-containing protein, partial [Pseudomonadota bacterium]
MPFRFDIDVPTAISVRDMWLGQIEKARRYTDATHPIEISVLEVRKCTKRVRALLRLIRPALPKRDWRRENDRWRDLGRALGVLRDHT